MHFVKFKAIKSAFAVDFIYAKHEASEFSVKSEKTKKISTNNQNEAAEPSANTLKNKNKDKRKDKKRNKSLKDDDGFVKKKKSFQKFLSCMW